MDRSNTRKVAVHLNPNRIPAGSFSGALPSCPIYSIRPNLPEHVTYNLTFMTTKPVVNGLSNLWATLTVHGWPYTLIESGDPCLIVEIPDNRIKYSFS